MLQQNGKKRESISRRERGTEPAQRLGRNFPTGEREKHGGGLKKGEGMAGSCWCHCYEVYLVDILIMIFGGIVMMMIKEKENKRVLKALEKCRKEFVVLRYSYFHCYCFYLSFCLFIISLAIVVVTVISVVVAGTFIVVAVAFVVTFVNAIFVITVIVIIVILVIPLLH